METQARHCADENRLDVSGRATTCNRAESCLPCRSGPVGLEPPPIDCCGVELILSSLRSDALVDSSSRVVASTYCPSKSIHYCLPSSGSGSRSRCKRLPRRDLPG